MGTNNGNNTYPGKKRKNYNKWIHFMDIGWAATLQPGQKTTPCGKTAYRIPKTNNWDDVTCPRCLEEK
jgi:hypothetical protein